MRKRESYKYELCIGKVVRLLTMLALILRVLGGAAYADAAAFYETKQPADQIEWSAGHAAHDHGADGACNSDPNTQQDETQGGCAVDKRGPCASCAGASCAMLLSPSLFDAALASAELDYGPRPTPSGLWRPPKPPRSA